MNNKHRALFLLTATIVLLVGLSALSATDIDNNATTTSDNHVVSVEKQVSTTNVATDDNSKIISKDNNIQKTQANQARTSNKQTKTIKSDSEEINYYVSDSTGSDDNDGSSNTPYKTINKAIGSTTTDNTYNIYIGEGTYTGTGNTNLTVNGSYHINFIGNGVNSTVLDGEVAYTINGGGVWGNDPNFNTYNITNGNWAMNITTGTGHITVKDMTIQNMLSRGGNSISAYPTATIDNYATLTVDNVYFKDNLAGVGAGIRNNNNSTLLVTDSIFEGNRKSSSTGNFGAGIYNNGTATVYNTQFNGNIARWGTVTNDKKITITNCTFRDGKAYNLASTYKFGSAIATNTGSADFNNQNSTENETGLVTNVINSTFINNEQSDIYQGKGNLLVDNCKFQNSTGIYIAGESVNNASLSHVIKDSKFDNMIASSMFYMLGSSRDVTFAIYNLGLSNTTIQNNTISTNTNAYALYLNGYNKVSDNVIDGYVYVNGNNNTLKGNNITSENRTYCIELGSNANNNTITYNTLYATIFAGNLAVRTQTNTNEISDNKPTDAYNITVTESNYNTYFDNNGNLNTNTVGNGSKIFLDSISNKDITIDNSRVYITGVTGATQTDCSITIGSNAKVTIYGLNMVNTNNNAITINSQYNTIEANTITTTTNNPTKTIIINADNNIIYNNTINTNGPANTITDNTCDTTTILIQSSNNNINKNTITTTTTTSTTDGTIEAITIKGTQNTITDNKITSQSNTNTQAINIYNNNNDIGNNQINLTAENNAIAINIINADNNIIKSQITINSNTAQAVLIQNSKNNTVNGITTNITATNANAIKLYNTDKTTITANDTTNIYYITADKIAMIDLTETNNTQISYVSPGLLGEGTVLDITNSINTTVEAVNCTNITNTTYYNTQVAYAQITNSNNIYIGLLVQDNFTQSATINTTKTPITITNTENIQINAIEIYTDNLYTIILNNTTNTSITNNTLLNNQYYNGGDDTVKQENTQQTTLTNNTPTITNITKLTNDNYNNYFTDGTYTGSSNTIVIYSDIYNKDMTFDSQITVQNPNRYTIYNTTITINGVNSLLNNLNIENTDTRTNTIVINKANTINNTNIKVQNTNTAEIITINKVAAKIINTNITATGNKILAIKLTTATKTQITNNTIKITANNATAITATDGEDIKINSNNITTNTTTPTPAILLKELTDSNIENNTIMVYETSSTSIIKANGKFEWFKKSVYIRYNYLQSAYVCGDGAVDGDASRYNVKVSGNTPSSTLNTLRNNKILKSDSSDLFILNEDTYNKYVDKNGILNDTIHRIELGSDLYNKNLTLIGEINLINPNNYTLYNSTIIFNSNTTSVEIHNMNIVNTDDRLSAFIIKNTTAYIDMYNLYIYQKNNNMVSTINLENSLNATVFIRYSFFNITSGKAILFNLNNSTLMLMYNNFTVSTKNATPIIIVNGMLSFGITGNTINVNESSKEPIILLNDIYADDESIALIIENYLVTPYSSGDDTIQSPEISAELIMIMMNYPNEDDNVTLIHVDIISDDNLVVLDDNLIQVEVTDLWGNKISEGNVSFKINNESISTVELVNGSASINFVPQAPGNYTIEVAYTDENGKYDYKIWIPEDDPDFGEMPVLVPCNSTKIINAIVVKKASNISLDSVRGSVGDVINLSAHVTYNGNVSVTGGRVEFKANGLTIRDSTGNPLYADVVNGSAVLENFTVPTSWIDEDSVVITAVYGETNLLASSRSSTVMNLSHRSATVSLEPVTVVRGATTLLTASVTDNGSLVTGGRVVFKLNDKSIRDSTGNPLYASVVNGSASVNFTVPEYFSTKDYKLSCVYNSKLYNRTEVSSTLTITDGVNSNIKSRSLTSANNSTNHSILVIDENNYNLYIKHNEATDYSYESYTVTGRDVSNYTEVVLKNIPMTVNDYDIPIGHTLTLINTSISGVGFHNNTTLRGGILKSKVSIGSDISNVTIDNVTADNGANGGWLFYIQCDHFTFKNSRMNVSVASNTINWLRDMEPGNIPFYIGGRSLDPVGNYATLENNNITINVVSADDQGYSTSFGIYVSGVGATIKGNNIEYINKEGLPGWLYAIYTTHANNTVIDNNIHVVGSNYTAGVYLDAWNGDVVNNYVANNIINMTCGNLGYGQGAGNEHVGYGITLTNQGYSGGSFGGGSLKNSTILNNTIYANGYAIYAVEGYGVDNTLIADNTIVLNGTAVSGISVIGVNSTITGNDITAHGKDNNTYPTADYLAEQTVGISLQRGSGSTIANNTINCPNNAGIKIDIEHNDNITNNVVTSLNNTYAVYVVSLSSDINVINNTLRARDGNGDNAVLTTATGNITDNGPQPGDTIITFGMPHFTGYIVGSDIIINGTLTDAVNNTLALENITLTINNNTVVTVTTDNNGVFTYHYTTNVTGDNIPVNAKFEDHMDFIGSEVTTSFDVEKQSTYITLNPIDVTVTTSEVNITGKLLEQYTDTPIRNATIIITTENKTYNAITDNNGEFKITITAPTNQNTYTIQVNYNGNNTYDKANTTTWYDVEKLGTTIILNPVNNTLINDTTIINGKIIEDYTTKTIENKTITLTVNDKQYNTTTDENGTININITAPNTNGIHNITITSDANNIYDTANTTTTIEVLKRGTTATLDPVTGVLNKTVTFTAHITDETGANVTGGYVIFKVNGVTLKDVNNENLRVNVINGTAVLTITATWKNAVSTTVVYSGDDAYITSRMVNGSINIVRQNATIKLEVLNDNLKPGKELIAIVRVTDENDNPITAGRVIFKLNGKTLHDYNNTPIVVNITNGVAVLKYRIPDNFSAKTYMLSAVYSGGIYNKVETTQNFTLSKLNAFANVNISSPDLKVGKQLIVVTNITDEDGNPVTRGYVLFKINGKTLKDADNNTIKADVRSGTATLNYTIPASYSARTYNLTAVFGGSNYNTVRLTKNFTVTKINTRIDSTNITLNNNRLNVRATIRNRETNNVAGERPTKVSVKLDGRTVIRETIVNNGLINLNTTLNNIKKGNHTVVITTGGNSMYNQTRISTIVYKT